MEQILTAASGRGGRPILQDPQFDRATFTAAAQFERMAFEGKAGFTGATFESLAWFVGATFRGDAAFDGATFQGEVLFGTTTFEQSRQLGPMLVRDELVLDEATFGQRVQTEAAAQALSCRRARFPAGVQFR